MFLDTVSLQRKVLSGNKWFRSLSNVSLLHRRFSEIELIESITIWKYLDLIGINYIISHLYDYTLIINDLLIIYFLPHHMLIKYIVA